jgi:hypothetical protein
MLPPYDGSVTDSRLVRRGQTVMNGMGFVRPILW